MYTTTEISDAIKFFAQFFGFGLHPQDRQTELNCHLFGLTSLKASLKESVLERLHKVRLATMV